MNQITKKEAKIIKEFADLIFAPRNLMSERLFSDIQATLGHTFNEIIDLQKFIKP